MHVHRHVSVCGTDSMPTDVPVFLRFSFVTLSIVECGEGVCECGSVIGSLARSLACTSSHLLRGWRLASAPSPNLGTSRHERRGMSLDTYHSSSCSFCVAAVDDGGVRARGETTRARGGPRRAGCGSYARPPHTLVHFGRDERLPQMPRGLTHLQQSASNNNTPCCNAG